jgi:poly(3-hydroxybutyrate) depolymerase
VTDTQENGRPLGQAPGGPGPCFANAYAITYRLLGERDQARATAEAVAAAYPAAEDLPPAEWLPDLATDAVTASLLAADAPLHVVTDPRPVPVADAEEAQPDETEPDETEPEEAQPDETEPDETEPDETEPEEAQPDEADADGAAEPEPDATDAEEARPESTEPEPQVPEPGGPEPGGAPANGPEPEHPGRPGDAGDRPAPVPDADRSAHGTPIDDAAVRPPPSAEDLSMEPVEDPSVAEQRRFLRRRLATLDGRSRAAAALRHLAGYDAARVATFMATDAATVEALAAPLTPPPGASWRDLGDPVVRGVAPAVKRRRRHRRLPWRSLLAVLVVLALVVLASRMTGPRPSLGRLDPGAGDRSFGPEVAPIASSGCVVAQETPPQPGVSAESIETPGGSTAYRVRTPEDPTAPAPLLVLLPGYGQSAQQFADLAQVESTVGDALVSTLEPPAPALEWNAGGETAGGDDRAATIAVTEEMIVSRCVDLARVHVIGFGPGGQLAGAVACAAPEVFASATMVGGAQMAERCPLRPDVSALLTANIDDPVIRPTGGYGPAADEQPGTGSFERPAAQPMDEVAQRWASAVGAGEEATRAEADDTLVRSWTGDNGVEVLSVLHPAGGHTWGLGDTVVLVDFLDRSARSG